MNYKHLVKDSEVLVDREAGEAYITVTLYSRNPKNSPTKIWKQELKQIAEEGGAEFISVISGKPIDNAYGEVTGKWTVKIPSTEPENSTTATLKRRKKRQQEQQEQDDS